MVQKARQMPKRLSLSYLINNDLPVWVRNNTGDPVTGEEPMVIVLQAGSGNSAAQVVIPPGDDPVCITDQVDPGSLKSFRDLFTAVRKKALDLLSPENAEQYYIDNEERRIATAEKIDKYLSGKQEEVMIPKEVERQTVTIQPKVGEICLRARHEASSARDTLESLIELSKILGEADYQYVMANGHYEGVKRWAKEQLYKAQTAGMTEAR